MVHIMTVLCGYLEWICSNKFKLRTLSRNLDFLSQHYLNPLGQYVACHIGHLEMFHSEHFKTLVKCFGSSFGEACAYYFHHVFCNLIFYSDFLQLKESLLLCLSFFSRAESRRLVSISIFSLFSLNPTRLICFFFMISLFWVRDFPTPKFNFVAIDLITPFRYLCTHTQLYFFCLNLGKV